MRTFVMGDPQAPFAKLLEVLDRHDALRGDRLADDVVLVSIGDHFDYDSRNWAIAADEGLRFLRWLASHDAAQVKLLLGNHDAARVMELAGVTDERFAAARALAQAIEQERYREPEFGEAFPDLPPAGVCGRDYASFTTAQRAMVQELLLAGRFQLALVGELADSRTALITHAGVTTRELGLLGMLGVDYAVRIAAALEGHLAGAVARVRDDWQRGVMTPLSLAPLHVAGGTGLEGGGLLYHRPTNPATGTLVDAERPRRFDPRTLPNGLTQIAGHNGHAKCVFELGDWCTAAARARKHGGIRTLRVWAEEVTYDLGTAADFGVPFAGIFGAGGASELILIDGELRRVPAAEVSLLPLARVL